MSVNYEEVENLVQAVLTPQSAQAHKARELLTHYGSSIVPRLCEVLPTAPEQSKWLIISILARIKDRRAVPTVGEYLYSENQAIQAVVAQYLGDSGDPTAVSLLVDALETLGDASAVIWIASALGKLQDTRAVRPLINLLESTTSPVVRYTSIAALGEIGDTAAIPVITRYQDDANHHVREHSQRALSLLNHEESV